MDIKSDDTLTHVEEDNRSRLHQEKPAVFEKVMKFGEKVARGESIAIVQFQYNYTCNFHCQHCSIKRFQLTARQEKEQGKRVFTIEDVRKLGDQAHDMGLAHVVITGGEPLIFRDFDQIVEAFDPSRFYMVTDTNGWHLDFERAKHLKAIGLDKVQLSLDSLDAEGHDAFRQKKGSYDRAIHAIDASLDADLNLILSTVVTKERIHSDEFIQFLEFAKSKGVGTFVTYAKPVGCWEGKYDMLIDRKDMAFMRKLEEKYNVFTHLTPAYGLDLGCIAVKRMISITRYGDVMPCPYIHVALGNVYEEPLKDIVERGMNLKYFGEHQNTCLVAEDREFIETYIDDKTYGKPLPVPWNEVFSKDDLISSQNQSSFTEDK